VFRPRGKEALVAAAFALVGGIAAIASAGEADTPRARRLAPSAFPSGAAPDAPAGDPARELPETATVCRDPAARRCWSAPDERDCARRGAAVFRTVIAGPGRNDLVRALAHCEEELRAGREAGAGPRPPLVPP
jgi:hypothetical protein